ncbi:MAG: dienelactone hydrolase family protein [Gemmatimonadota bacterium]|nr:dienelactone hydrolase family protein [Gemmatimonadota bacterium]
MSDVKFEVGADIGTVSGILRRPPDARLLYVLAHGAGAGMRHRFMEAMSEALAACGIASLRYQFPYMEAGGRPPDPPAVLHATVRAAVAEAARVAPDLPLVAGGKSLGGRMTSGAAARDPLPGVAGLAFLGFPLHPAKRPGTSRAEHLGNVKQPMLFLQGTRDDLADLELMTAVCRRLGPGATLHVVEGANHAFEVLKRSGRTDEDVRAELARTVAAWYQNGL